MENSLERRGVDFAAGLACACVAVAVASVGFLNNHRFFFTDDFQTYAIPMYKEVARLLLAGHLPFITDRMWMGGAILSEYQFAIFNPFSILLYLVTYPIHDLPLAAAIFSLFHLAVLASGTYALCRALGCKPRFAILAGMIISTTDWILFWSATNWVTILVGFAWMPWAWAALIWAYRSGRGVIPAALGVALVLTAGWPTGNVALVIPVFVFAAVLWGRDAAGYAHGFLRVAVSVVAGGLLAAPAILPVIPYLQFSERAPDVGKWFTSLAVLANVGSPFFVTAWWAWGNSYGLVLAPMVFVAWFIPVVLANTNWRTLLASPRERAVLFFAFFLAVLSMTPGYGSFRWMFRMLPYLDLALLVLVALILTRESDGEGSRWKRIPTLIALGIPLLLAIDRVPDGGLLYLYSTGIVAILILISNGFFRIGQRPWVVFAASTNIALVVGVILFYTSGKYPSFPNEWIVPSPFQANSSDEASTRRFSIFPIQSLFDVPPAEFWQTLTPGNTPLLTPVTSINGYSPFGIKSFKDTFCFQHLTAINCPSIIDRITSPTGQTGLNLLDLMRVNELVIQDADKASQFRAKAGTGWTYREGPLHISIFTRSDDALAPGKNVGWASDGVTADAIDDGPSRLTFSVRNASDKEGTLVISRAWYPGWSAELDGKDLTVTPLAGMLISVSLPPRSEGRLTVSYWPALFWPGVFLAIAGIVLLAGAETVMRRRRVAAVPA